MAAISAGPKKKDCCTKSVPVRMGSVIVSVSCSYSRWLCVTRGGSLAWRSSLCQTGRIDGSFAPRAISTTAYMK